MWFGILVFFFLLIIYEHYEICAWIHSTYIVLFFISANEWFEFYQNIVLKDCELIIDYFSTKTKVLLTSQQTPRCTFPKEKCF